MKNFKFLLILGVLGVISGIGLAGDLVIERENRSIPYVAPENVPSLGAVKRPNGLFFVSHLVPPDFLVSGYDPVVEDPFGGGTVPEKKEWTAQEILEGVGIAFGPGASANYNPKTSMLSMTNTASEIDLLQVYVGTGCLFRSATQVAVRTEIYELPALQALQLIESAEAEGRHQPERDAVLNLTRDGHAKLVASHSLLTTSGRRAKMEDVVEVAIPAEIYPLRKNDQGEEKAAGVLLDVRPFGTTLEAEVSLDADAVTLNIDLSVEHHTGEPEMSPVTSSTQAPRFHPKKISTNVTLHSGDYLLLGSWKPKGKSEYSEKNLMHVVFLTANLQTIGGYGLKEAASLDKAVDESE